MAGKFFVETDGHCKLVEAETIAQLCNKIRGSGKRFRIWSPSGLHIIDTKFGDTYNLAFDPSDPWGEGDDDDDELDALRWGAIDACNAMRDE